MTRPQLRTEAERGTRDRLAMELQALPGRSTRELQEAWQRLIRRVHRHRFTEAGRLWT